ATTYDTGTDIPLASKVFAWTDLPYQADTGNGPRGTQQGYNRCNSTTEGPNSWCQTATVNHLDDFCLWAPPMTNSTIADTEGETVAWCTKKGRGTRTIPGGALTGVQYMVTPDYVQVIGFINQALIDMNPMDSGGELDPHGADLRGNALGALMYSNAFPSNNGNNGTFQQVHEWHNFMGGGMFCIKVCDPAGANAANYCQHIYDRIGCKYNAPATYTNNTFVACQGESQDFPGVYTSNGVVMTYTQPAESLGPISTIPYDPRIPASSNCVTYSSTALYTDLVQPTSASTSASGAATHASGSTTKGGSAGPAATGGSSSNSAGRLGSAESSMCGVLATVAVGLLAFGAML
ncbi:hypothetical protein BOTBODRAFT_93667, partial [Botryobasidium botryosum FD-172 SS1]